MNNISGKGQILLIMAAIIAFAFVNGIDTDDNEQVEPTQHTNMR